MATRILLTGSRVWRNYVQLRSVLDTLHAKYSDMVLVHGDAKSGADRMGRVWAIARGVDHEPHPAEWIVKGSFDRTAGIRRNKEMVDLGAALCVAFQVRHSEGTQSTIDFCERAGIPVELYRIR